MRAFNQAYVELSARFRARWGSEHVPLPQDYMEVTYCEIHGIMVDFVRHWHLVNDQPGDPEDGDDGSSGGSICEDEVAFYASDEEDYTETIEFYDSDDEEMCFREIDEDPSSSLKRIRERVVLETWNLEAAWRVWRRAIQRGDSSMHTAANATGMAQEPLLDVGVIKGSVNKEGSYDGTLAITWGAMAVGWAWHQ